MKYFRYIFLLVVMLLGITALAQDFNPDNPPEPMARYKLTVQSNPSEAATVSKGGRYEVNQSVYVSTFAKTKEWKFINWTKKDGTVASTSTSFYYQTTNANETLTANYERVKVSKVELSTNVEDKCYLYGQGVYQVGEYAYIECSPYGNYDFMYWATPDGKIVSDQAYFNFMVTEENVHLVAYLKFNPSSPNEPSEAKNKHRIRLKTLPEGTGYFNCSDNFEMEEGTSIGIRTYARTNWMFKQWEANGVVISDSEYYVFEMGKEDVTLVARYVFYPVDPDDPLGNPGSAYTLYGVQSDVYKGQTLMYPVYFENAGSASQLSFNLCLPDGFTLDTSKVKLSESRASAFQVQTTEAKKDAEGTWYHFDISGGTEISGSNGVLMYLPITAANTLVPKAYRLNFDQGKVWVGGYEQNLTFRSGVLKVNPLDESGLRAQFMVDSYLNRVQFTNNSTESAKSFVWDFGDGQTSTEPSPMHIYPTTGGTYLVKLTAKGVVAENTAEQSIHVNASSVWTASGDYTVNPDTVSVRNFVSMQEAVEILSACKINGHLSFALCGNATYGLDLRQESLLNQFLKIAEDLKHSGFVQTFSTLDNSKATLSIVLSDDAAQNQKIVDWCRDLQLKNVDVLLDGVKLDFSFFNIPAEQKLCTAAMSHAVPFSSVSANPNLSVAWEAEINPDSQLEGYVLKGTGDLPAMRITNKGTDLGVLKYHVVFSISGKPVYRSSYTLWVKPSILNSRLTYYSPGNGSELAELSQDLDWNDVKGAIGYRVEIKRLEYGVVTDDTLTVELDKDQSRYTVQNLKPGAQYVWQVFALGECDELAGEIWTFTMLKRSDLTVEEVKTVSAARGLTTIKVTAKIANRGERETWSSYWYDAIYVSSRPNDWANAQYVKTMTHNGSLAAGASYTVTFEVKVPDVSVGQVYYYIKTDYNRNEPIDANEENNHAASEKVLLVDNLMNESDYAALKGLYQATNGEAWKRPWNITSNAIVEGHWPGVTFDNDGHVTAINLNDNQLRGEVPSEGFVLPYLEKLTLRNNSLKGDITAFVKSCPALKELDLSENQFTTLSGPLSDAITELNLSYQHEHGGREFLTVQEWNMQDVISPVELTDVQAYDHQSHDFSAHPDLNVYSREMGTYLGVLVHDGNDYRLQLSGDFKEKSGVSVFVRVANGPAYHSYLRATLSYVQGDANTDGIVSVLDAQQTLNRILDRQRGNFNFTAADTWTDGIINVQDIVKTINLFVVEEPVIPSYVEKESLAAQPIVGQLVAEDGKVRLNTSRPVAALDMTLQGVSASQLALRLPKSQFQMIARNVEGGVRVVIFSPAGREIPAGDSHILSYASATAEILRVECADIDALPMNICAGEQTGVGEVVSTEVQVKVDHRRLVLESSLTLPQVIVTVYDASGKRMMQEICGVQNGLSTVLSLPSNLIGTGVVVVEAQGHAPVIQKIFLK